MARRRYKSGPNLAALALLQADHDKVLDLFRTFERLRPADDDELAVDIVDLACHELVLHAPREDELVASLVRAAVPAAPRASASASTGGGAAPRAPGGRLAAMAPAAGGSVPAVAVLPEDATRHPGHDETSLLLVARTAGIDMHRLAGHSPHRPLALEHSTPGGAWPGTDPHTGPTPC